MSWYRYESDGVILRLYVQPGAKKNEVVGLIEDELKIKLAATPIEGRANAELLKYLSRLFRVPKSKILLKSGEKSRHKMVEIRGCVVPPERVLIQDGEL
jgi:hypothetical protein